MEIVLKKLQAKNFKGLREISLNFSQRTNIYGDNGTGKTTINDMYNYLITGKDSLDRSTFEIKTLEENGEAIHFLEHGVNAELVIDGHLLTLAKVYREKWNTKKGYSEKTFNGHETLYYINDIPTTLKDYQAKINEIIGEETFKLLTNPLYFSQGLKWQKAREILLKVLGEVEAEEIIKANNKLEELKQLLQNEENIENIKKGLKAKISRLKKEKADIPSRIDEVFNMIVPENKQKELELEAKKIEIEEIENKINNFVAQNEEKMKNKEKLYNLKKEYDKSVAENLKSATNPAKELSEKYNECEINMINLENKIEFSEKTIRNIVLAIQYLQKQITELDCNMERLRQEYKKIKSEKFKPNLNKTCKSCGQAIPVNKLEETTKIMKEYFDKENETRASFINKEGQRLKAEKEKYKTEIDTRNVEIESEKAKLYDLKQLLIKQKELSNELYKKIRAIEETVEIKGNEEIMNEIKEIEKIISTFDLSTTNTLELKAKRNTLISDVRLLKRELEKQNNNDALRCRIEELKDEEQKAAQQIAILEKQEYLCEVYMRTKVEMMETNINKKFGDSVNFKLFHEQVNGGLEECCEATIDGVPFSNANTASKINAGLSIINVLCDYYNIYAPIIIDNRESVNKIVDTKSQVVNLIVSNDKELRIEYEK